MGFQIHFRIANSQSFENPKTEVEDVFHDLCCVCDRSECQVKRELLAHIRRHITVAAVSIRALVRVRSTQVMTTENLVCRVPYVVFIRR